MITPQPPRELLPDEATARRAFATEIAAACGVADDAVLAAFEAVPRHRFAGPGPWVFAVAEEVGWLSPDDDVRRLMHNVAWVPPGGRPSPKPSELASCLQVLGLPRAGRVLYAGPDAYAQALLAEIVGPQGIVDVVEPDAARRAELAALLAPWPQARLHPLRPADAGAGYHAIWVGWGCSRVPVDGLDALIVEGRLLFDLVGTEGRGWAFVAVKPRERQANWWAGGVMPRRAPPSPWDWSCDEAALFDAAHEDLRRVSSLRLACHDGDATVLAGEGWCLSARPPQAAGESHRALDAHEQTGPTLPLAKRGEVRGAEGRKAAGVRLGLSPAHAAVLAELDTPQRIQDFLNAVPTNHDMDIAHCLSVAGVLTHRVAMCMEGALVAACALYLAGERPLLLVLTSSDGEDHAITLFLRDGHWGAISKTNHAWARWRDPIYRSLRELVMSYVHEHVTGALKTLRGYTRLVDLRRVDPALWVSCPTSCRALDGIAYATGQHPLMSEAQAAALRPRDALELKAGELIEHPAPLARPAPA